MSRSPDTTMELIKVLREEARDREKREFLMRAEIKPYSGSRNPAQLNNFFQEIHSKAEGFQLNEEQLIILAGKNLKGPALKWYTEYKEASRIPLYDYKLFKEDIKAQFIGDFDISMLISKYWNLKQTRSVEIYNKQVSQLREELPKGIMPEEVQISAYLEGLKKRIQREVRLKRPKTLMEAMRIAITYDDSIEITKTKSYLNENYGKYNQRANQTDDMEIDNITSRPRMARYPRACYICQKEGHLAAKCPKKSKN